MYNFVNLIFLTYIIFMKVLSLQIPEVKIIEPEVYTDSRGWFFESFNQKKINEVLGANVTFVQDNHSESTKGVLRGLHYQSFPGAQDKLVRVIQGEVFDVAVDIRENSSTFGQYVGHVLSAQNKKQMWIPKGFAHGFLTLSNSAQFLYKVTDYYNADLEQCILWDDCSLAISWPRNLPISLSKKDQQGKSFLDAETFKPNHT